METETTTIGKNSVDSASYFTRMMDMHEGVAFQIIGGVNSAALIHPDSVIDFDEKAVYAPSTLHLSTIRDDGSVRDIDIFVPSSDERVVGLVKDQADIHIGHDLEPSVFGVRPYEALLAQANHPMGFYALKTFLSDRYETPGGLVKSLFPFSVELDCQSIEPWTLQVGDNSIPIPNPAMSIVNYTNRSISGLRPKDAKKVEAIAENVFSKEPRLRDWAIDGPAASQVKLASLICSLSPDGTHTDILNVKSGIVNRTELIDHEAFMLRDLSDRDKAIIIGAAAAKAAALSLLESQEWIVGTFNRMKIEKSLGSIVNNK